jgi:protein gp37
MNAIESKSKIWNLWHGCHKLSAGCRHCYVYRGDLKRGIDSTVVFKTKLFDLPVQRKRNGDYKIPSGTLVYTCFTSDFFLEDADVWRKEAWEMIRQRSDLRFMIITKRIDRLQKSLPDDWGDGYDNVTICCTVETQDRADYRLPIYKEAPIKHKIIICEPLLERIDLSGYDIGSWAEQVVAGGESGYNARPCNFDWVMELHNVCMQQNVSF